MCLLVGIAGAAIPDANLVGALPGGVVLGESGLALDLARASRSPPAAIVILPEVTAMLNII